MITAGFFAALGLLSLAAVVALLPWHPMFHRKGWYLVTKIGVDYGPFRTEAAARNYPNTFWGWLADAPAFRHGWHVEHRD